MDLRYNRPLRIISVIVLAFFLWTFGGLCEIVYALKDSDELRVTSDEKKQKKQKPEEKFQKTIEDIENILTDTVTDTNTKKNKLKTKKAEIGDIDVELRKEFSNTEKFLKEKGLPAEILQRHNDFVRKYEDNLNELNTNLDAIDRAKTEDEVKVEIEKLKAFLEKVKPPKKHIPLDPNKLPHRTAEPVWIEPRTSPEQFKEIQDAGYTIQDKKYHASGIANRESILVASAGPLDGLLTQDSKYFNNAVIPEVINRASRVFPKSSSPLVGEGWGEGATLNSEPSTQNLIVAQATNLPTLADLSETIEVQFTPEIKAKAEELNHNPVKIYNWVRNNIEFVPSYGSIQGANMCLQTKQCNAFDTASLLIALLRASNIPARYVYGTIELPIEKVMNWVGGFTDANAALTLIASGGIPVTGLTSGGKITMVRMEHVWVEAYVPYGPYSGRPSKLDVPKTWIPLDPSYKQYNYTQGIDLQTAVPFDAQGFIDQLKVTGTVNEAEGYVTNLDSNLILSALTDYKNRFLNYSQTMPNATVNDLFGKKEIVSQDLGILPVTLPYKLVAAGNKYSTIPDNLRHKITFTVIKDIYDELTGTPINITKSLPELAGKRITLSYAPATQADADTINSYLPKPHSDGSPIQPSEFPTSLPAYLINLKPELKIDGVTVAIGSSVGMGASTTFSMQFYGPRGIGNEIITNQIVAGEYLGITLNAGKTSLSQVEAQKAKLATLKAKLDSGLIDGLTKDDLVGELLYTTIFSYFVEIDTVEYMASSVTGVVNLRLPSEGVFSQNLNVSYIFGIPRTVSFAGLNMDVDRILSIVIAKNGNKDKAKQFMILTGMRSSALEHEVPEKLFTSIDNPAWGISAVKALKIANDQGIPIYTIDQSNVATVLPLLQLDSETIADIKNAVNAGKVVTVSKTNINFNGWNGCGYIVMDSNTGAAAYMIGGIGGAYILLTILWACLFILAFIGALTLPFWYGVVATVLAAVLGISISNFIKKVFGIDGNLSLQQVMLAIIDIIGQVALSAGLVALLGAGVPAGIVILAAVFIIAAMIMLDYIIFFAWLYRFEKYELEVIYV